MANFRDLSGNFFSIPDEDLKKYKISPEELQSKLKEEQVTGTEIGKPGTDIGKPPLRVPSHITINQFFSPTAGFPLTGIEQDDAPIKYTYPAAWGGSDVR